MGNARLDESQAGIKIAGRNISNLRYADDTTLGASLVAQRLTHLPGMRETGFDPWVGKIPWRRNWHPTPVFLAEEFHGQRSLAGSMGSQRATNIIHQVCHSFSPKEQTSFNFMAAVIA